MNFEGKGKKFENSDAQENKAEKKLSLSEIDELIKEKASIFDNLDKFSKDEIFKKENFSDLRVAVDRPDDKFDESAYAKAGFWKKYENFFRLGFQKERYGLVKSKDRGLLDKTKINKDISGKGFKVEGGERQYLEENVVDILQDFKKKNSEREVVKAFGFDDADSRIIKYVGSVRTEKGQIEAAGKMREDKINQLEIVSGKELVGLKESLEKSVESQKNFSKLKEFMSNEEKEKTTAKLEGEENQTKEKIKEKEEKLTEETNKFREPLEGRLQETLEIENSLTEAFDFIKTGESNLNKQIKECESFIKEAQKLDLLGDVGGDVVKIFEGKKAELDTQAKEFAERKALVESKLGTLKNNRTEIYNSLFRINDIGKTEEEKNKEIRGVVGYYENKIKNKSETKTNPTENKKSGTESADTKKDKDDERNNEYKFKKFKEFFERFKEKFPIQGEQVTKLFNPSLSHEKFKEIVDQINLREQPPKEGVYDDFYYEIGNRGRSLTVKYFENGRVTVSVHFEESTEEKKDDERGGKTWDETRDEVWGLNNKQETVPVNKGNGEKIDIGKLFEHYDDVSEESENKGGREKKENQKDEKVKKHKEGKPYDTVENSKKAKILDENSSIAVGVKKIEEVKDQKRIVKQAEIKNQKIEGKNEEVKKILTEKEITEIVLKELKVLKVSVLGGSTEDKRIRTEAMKNLPILMKSVFANLAKFKDKFEEKDIKKEVQEWHKKFTKNNSKKSK